MVHDNDNTCISEERLTALMKKIFSEELEEQQSLLKLISGNFEIMKEIKNIESEVKELKKKHWIYREFIAPDEVEKKLTNFEDRSRRNNLRIDGVAEKMVRAETIASKK